MNAASGSEAIGDLARHRLAGHEIDLDRFQSALRESDEWWDALFNVAGIGILFGTVDGEILAATPSVVELLGYTVEELKEIGILEITHPDDREADLQMFTELVAGTRDSYQLEKRYIRKDQTLLWGRLTVVLLRNESGEPVFVIGMAEDITAAKHASEVQAQLEQAQMFKKQALELNDDVLQGLVVAKLAFDSDDAEKGRKALAQSLSKLKQVIDHMLAHGAGLEAGDFVRGHLMVMGRMDD